MATVLLKSLRPIGRTAADLKKNVTLASEKPSRQFGLEVWAIDVISVTPVRVRVWNSCTCRVNPGHIGDAACTEPDSKECLQLSEGTRYRRILIQQWPPRHQAPNGVLSALAPICLYFP